MPQTMKTIQMTFAVLQIFSSPSKGREKIRRFMRKMGESCGIFTHVFRRAPKWFFLKKSVRTPYKWPLPKWKSYHFAMGEKIRKKAGGWKKFAELCGKWVNPAAYSHMRGSHWLMWSRHHSVFCPDGRTAKELGSSQTTTTT